jgi:Leucine-rich repeat (LRR) protein
MIRVLTERFFIWNSRYICFSFLSAIPPQKNCSIDGSVYTSDKQVIESFPFDVSINPPLPHPSPPTSSYALVDIKGHVIELTLVNIESVPPAVFCLSQVQVLSLLDSTDLSIPPEISRLASSLISFAVSNTSASLILPPELFNMPVLSTLSIVNSGLETLSEDIGKLEKLTQLTLDGNQLLTLPGALSKLPSLTYLSVNNNPRLSSLDALDGSTSLVTLRGSNCLIDHLPTNINHLRTIEMAGNRLTSLDNMETITSESCDLLSFGGNQIASISSTSLEKIQTLLQFDLSGNQFITLPDSVYQIKDLQMLDIRQNYFNAKEKEWIQGLFRLTNTTVLI